MTRVMDMIRAMRARHAMLSFHDARQIEEASEVCQSIVLDNGAFSAWRQGIPYNFAGYQTWAAYWLKHPCVESAVVPDVIDATEQENDQLLSEWSLPLAVSVPRYHLHESLERLNRLCAYPRIALGSSGQFAHPGSREWWSRLAQIMTCLCDQQGYPRCKLHGLRMLDPVIFSHVPLASADSCNVARNIGIDSAWTGPYAPRSRWARALVMMDRIESSVGATVGRKKRRNAAEFGVTGLTISIQHDCRVSTGCRTVIGPRAPAFTHHAFSAILNGCDSYPTSRSSMTRLVSSKSMLSARVVTRPPSKSRIFRSWRANRPLLST